MSNGINKWILTVVNLIIIIVLIISIFKGININDKIDVLSYKQIQQRKADYAVVVDDYNSLLENEYSQAITKLEKEKNDYETSKQKYEQIRNVNSYEELVRLTQNKEYNIEFLWVKLDLIAKNNNLNAKFDISKSMTGAYYDIAVTLNGEYIGVKDYIYDILIDMDLQFRSDNITILPSDDGVEATFTISNVNIVM